MSAQKKIEKLTDSWYGFDIVSGVFGVFINGLGFFSLLFAAVSILFSLFLTFLIGRKLKNRGKLTRLLMIGASAIFTVTGVMGTATMGKAFIESWSIAALLSIALMVMGTWMMIRSFRTLTDREVKAHFQA
jgi:ABC-type transport system involved in multi-copper enzyme maturation permease subunit